MCCVNFNGDSFSMLSVLQLCCEFKTYVCNQCDALSPASRVNFLFHSLSLVPVILFMAALWNGAGHYIFAMWFLSSSVFFPSRYLSGRRMDVYHTSTHDVVLVPI